jgi:hypothetical protein
MSKILLREHHHFGARYEAAPRATMRGCLVTSLTSFALFGSLLGASHSTAQAAIAAVKLPVLFFATTIICAPAYLVLRVVGGDDRPASVHAATLLGALAATGTVLAALAPVTLFFLTTNDHYQSFKLVNLGVLGIAGAAGLKFLTQTAAMKSWRGAQHLWMALFAFVGLQLAWLLRPFFGAPDYPLEVLRSEPGNAFVNIVGTMREVLGMR